MLKKSSLDCNIMKKYRPVSSLPFISKTVEKSVAVNLQKYLRHSRTVYTNGVSIPSSS